MNLFPWQKISDRYWIVEAATDRKPVVAYVFLNQMGQWIAALSRAFDYYDDDMRIRAALHNKTFDILHEGSFEEGMTYLNDEFALLKCRFVNTNLSPMG